MDFELVGDLAHVETIATGSDIRELANRGRSIDARSLSDDLLTGRPITKSAIDGLLYETVGGRATIEVPPRVTATRA